MRQQAALRIDEATFRACHPAPDLQHLAFGAHPAGLVGHATHQADLVFERGVALAGRKRRMDRAAHGGVEQGGRVAAVHRTDRVVEIAQRFALEHGTSEFGFNQGEIEGLADRRQLVVLVDGTEFDSSYKRSEPSSFGVTGVIKGWTEALQMMPTGSKWQLFVPSELAYGPNGAPPKIGPNAVLTFEIELQDIKAPATPSTAAATPSAAGAVTSDIIKVPSKSELEKGAKIEVIKKEDLERLQKEAAARRATNAPLPVPTPK